MKPIRFIFVFLLFLPLHGENYDVIDVDGCRANTLKGLTALGLSCFSTSDTEAIESTRLVYLTTHSFTKGLAAEEAISYSQEHDNTTCAFHLADAQLTEEYRERIWALLPKIDLLILNARESYSLTRLAPKEAAHFLKSLCRTVVITDGERGCWVGSRNLFFHSPAMKVAVVDKKGGSDHFVSAFLYAYLQGCSLKECAKLGNLAASHAITTMGEILSPSRWAEIRKECTM